MVEMTAVGWLGGGRRNIPSPPRPLAQYMSRCCPCSGKPCMCCCRSIWHAWRRMRAQGHAYNRPDHRPSALHSQHCRLRYVGENRVLRLYDTESSEKNKDSIMYREIWRKTLMPLPPFATVTRHSYHHRICNTVRWLQNGGENHVHSL